MLQACHASRAFQKESGFTCCGGTTHLAPCEVQQRKPPHGLDFAVRASVIGDGYHHRAESWLMIALCLELGYLSALPTMGQINRREVCQLHVVQHNSC